MTTEHRLTGTIAIRPTGDGHTLLVGDPERSRVHVDAGTRADVRALRDGLTVWLGDGAPAGAWPLLVEMLAASDVDADRLPIEAMAEAQRRYHRACGAVVAYVRAHLATPPALTVGQALADARVQDGSHVVETFATDERCTEQLRLRHSGRLSSREHDRGRWGDWFASSDLSTAPGPCRLVPIADADADPATRGEMP